MPVSQGRRQQNSLLVRVLSGHDRPVFVGGCPRSGTTLLGTMLHAHPQLAIPPETRFVVESFKRRNKFGDLRQEANRAKVGDWIVNTKKTRFDVMKIDGDRVIQRVKQSPPTIGSLSGAVLAEFAAAHGATRWGDKRPKYVENLRLLFRLYPDMQFIHLIRDARGCTASLKKLGWWGWGAPEALDRWRRSIDAGIAAREYLGPDQYIELRYEDLVDDPKRELSRLCEFLNISFDDAMLRHHETGAELIDRPYHDRIGKPVDAAAVEKWRQDLDNDELALVEKKVGYLLDEFGYQRLDLPPVSKELEKRYNKFRKGRGKANRKTATQDRVAKSGYAQPVTARLTTGQKRLYYLLRLARRA